ncbi:Cytidylyltransferase family [Seminavis robusta]|uniref:Cytidylyltransferase family n=1 Tax=Seminavis robusta TaxID=568900 RepID=A0A9N8E589_9STRA|nr:Cytidylyltransferase family [Seminavis robusta]|eukprot:Sro631_g178570.1 Cytidylyltransferase family (215) ;mRNA; r:46373-47017
MLDNDALIRLSVLIALIVGFQVLVSHASLEREAKRRWQHALTGHIIVQASYIIPMSYGNAGLWIGAVGMAYIRFYHPDKFMEAFGPLLRPEELEASKLPGAFYFLIGSSLTATIFDLPIARYAVECLAIADPMAAFVGKSVPSPKLNQSASVAGCFACFITSLIVGYLMIEDASLFQLSMGALGCTLAEAMPFGNDNLTIPLMTAVAVTCVSNS